MKPFVSKSFLWTVIRLLDNSDRTKPVLIVGAGISGIACARELRDHGVPFKIINKGMKIGGRMASKSVRDSGTQYDGRVFDIGASYFTVSDPGFMELTDSMLNAGVVADWTDTFHVADSQGLGGVKVGPMRYTARRGIRSVVEYLAQNLDITEGEVTDLDEIVLREQYSSIALCMPTPQAAKIYPEAATISPAQWEPVIAVSFLFAEKIWRDFDGVFVNGDNEITWIANDGTRRGDHAPALVAHVHPVLASHHLMDPQAVIPFALRAVQRTLGFIETPIWSHAHRWTFAKPLEGSTSALPLSHVGQISLAGDEFSEKPRVEAAWLSGRDLGRNLAQKFS